MDILNAYWRMDYVQSQDEKPPSEHNPFVSLPKMGDDRAALIVHRGEFHYLVLNKFPYNPGHMLIVPYEQIAELKDLSVAARSEMMELMVFAQDLLKRAISPDSFNIGLNLGKTAGAGIPEHLHCHIVPRWNGDVNFMPVIGKTRVLPQALDQTWQVLKQHLND